MSKITVKDTNQIAEKFLNQIKVVKELIDGTSISRIKTTINDFLSGKDVAGIGQGRFTNNVKNIIQEKWNNDVKSLCSQISTSSENNLDENIKKLQKTLIGYCQEHGQKSKNNEPIVPWAAIHAMVAVLRPQDFCTIVSENNLDNLYNLLAVYYSEETDDKASDDETKTDIGNGEGTDVETGDREKAEVIKIEGKEDAQSEINHSTK